MLSERVATRRAGFSSASRRDAPPSPVRRVVTRALGVWRVDAGGGECLYMFVCSEAKKEKAVRNGGGRIPQKAGGEKMQRPSSHSGKSKLNAELQLPEHLEGSQFREVICKCRITQKKGKRGHKLVQVQQVMDYCTPL